MKRFRFLIVALMGLFVAMTAFTALAQTRIPDPTQEQIDSARGFAQFREKVLFNDALFGLGKLPKNCSRGLIDADSPPQRSNYVITCNGPITLCEAQGVDCDDEADAP